MAGLLEREGLQIERGVAGMPTAFVASFGSGRPVLGILAEFDALPGIGNEAVPRREPRKDGVPNGHGCGHNLFGAGSAGAAIALKRAMQALHLPGTLKLFGTPAEETLVGKAYMARDGVFDGLDAALDWHPGLETKVSNDSGQALNNFTVEFFGKAAHGARDPWNGRSALDAVELMTHGATMMREHVPTTARIHYVIAEGGEAPNVVPAFARVWFYVRDVDRPRATLRMAAQDRRGRRTCDADHAARDAQHRRPRIQPEPAAAGSNAEEPRAGRRPDVGRRAPLQVAAPRRPGPAAARPRSLRVGGRRMTSSSKSRSVTTSPWRRTRCAPPSSPARQLIGS
ncbi:MAG TPA: amidohydrolase [Vicinamibacteria bacterium]|nr:amidohydrolase [Vicinamibacteria bacterium]